MDDYDISGKIGDMFPERDVEWPMYSFRTPAVILWSAIATGLHARGWTDEQIGKWLRSKETRWALDGELGEAIEKLGTEYAATVKNHVRS